MDTPAWDVEVFYDGDCPLCMREINMLRKRDSRGLIHFVDIAANDFDAAAYGKDRASFMERIQGRLPDGTWIEGVEVFRRLYTAIGFGRLVALTRVPGVSHLLDAGYSVFAKNRLRLTGRCDSEACALPEAKRGSAA